MQTTSLPVVPQRSAMSESAWLAIIVVVGLLIRIAAIVAYSHVPESDELEYITMARNFIAHRGIFDTAGNAAMYNAGYPLFVLAPVFWLSGTNLLAVKLINALLGCLAIMLCHAVAKQAGAGRPGRLLAAAFWALYLPASLYVVYAFKENLLTPLMLGVLWCVLRLRHEMRPRVIIACGILFGLIALTGNAGLVLAVPLLFSIFYKNLFVPKKWAALLVIVAVAGAVTSPWLVRNARLLGAPVLNTNGGFNLYLGNNPNANGQFISIADTPRGASWEGLRKQGEIFASETLKKDAVTWIKNYPAQFSQLAVKKFFLFWSPPFHNGKGEASRLEQLIRIVWAIQYLLLCVLALATLAQRSGRTERTTALWLALGAYSGVHMIFYVVFRYREPIMPLLCILAAMALDHIIKVWLIRRADVSVAPVPV
jgi:4-amino-4-deoxy-L-arabinose transferase-like glycosyltransferase